jgi:nicotinamidase-related amidase
VKSALVLVDLQNDYFQDDELARCRDDLLDACNQLIEGARRQDALVVEVQTLHTRDRRTWALNMLEDGQGVAVEGTRGAQRLDGLKKPDHLVVKTRDSAFHDTDFAEWLRVHDVGHIVLAGVSTESCIAATAIDAYAHDLRVTLIEDATASVEWRLHDQTLEQLRRQYRQDVQRAAEATFRADRARPTKGQPS